MEATPRPAERPHAPRLRAALSLFLSLSVVAAPSVRAAGPAAPDDAPISGATLPLPTTNKPVVHHYYRHHRRTHRTSTTSSAAAKIKAAPLPKTLPAESHIAAQRAATGAAIETRLDSFQRNVEVQPYGSQWRRAERQMPLITQDKIRTGSSSVARLKLADGTKVLLLQNSQAEMSSLSSVEKSIRLMKGRLRAIVAKIKGGNNFQITTPVGVASVRGTDFEVNVNDDGSQMEVRVFEGSVAVAKLGNLANEVLLAPGDKIKFGAEGELAPDAIKTGEVPLPRNEIRNEIQLASAKDAVLSAAAEESRNADYQTGKSLIDVNGRRVRVEEYIMRPASNQFKLVVLNERSTRFDYFTYKGTFNKDLPEDLSVALKQVPGQLGTAPDYSLTGYETLMSNTVDKITESATGGHLVKISFDGTNYTLTDPSDPSNTRTVAAAAIQPDGTYKVYNPIQDSFSLVSAADKDDAMKISVLDGGSYRNLSAGDLYFRTRFNDYTSGINNVLKTAYAKKSTVTNTLAVDFDADFSNAPIMTVSEQPSGPNSLHNKLSLYYGDGSKTTYDTYIIDDKGTVAPSDTFSNITTSADYRNAIDGFNYEQCVSSDEMQGRNIDLVVDPRIGTVSGLIQ